VVRIGHGVGLTPAELALSGLPIRLRCRVRVVWPSGWVKPYPLTQVGLDGLGSVG
jgi:hypothetical protein